MKKANNRTRRIEKEGMKETILKLNKNNDSKIITKSLKIEKDIADKIKLGGALINKTQGDFISLLVHNFFTQYKTHELGKIIDDIENGKLELFSK